MRSFLKPILIALLLIISSPARANPPSSSTSCKLTLSGGTSGTFDCTVRALRQILIIQAMPRAGWIFQVMMQTPRSFSPGPVRVRDLTQASVTLQAPLKLWGAVAREGAAIDLELSRYDSPDRAMYRAAGTLDATLRPSVPGDAPVTAHVTF